MPKVKFRIQGIELEENENGDLIITADDVVRKFAKYRLKNFKKSNYLQVEYEILEPVITNGFELFSACDFGELSEMPFIGLLVRLPEEDAYLNYNEKFWHLGGVDWDKSKVWCYPEYQIRSFVDDLIENGQTKFINIKNM